MNGKTPAEAGYGTSKGQIKPDKKGVSEGFDDIINLPHHVSKRHPPMPVTERAAQFSPFAALSGYEDAIRETGRLTDERMELDEDEKLILNEKLQILKGREAERPEVRITYFKPDEYKKGGAYVTVSGRIKKIGVYEGMISLEDGTRIPIENMTGLEGDVLLMRTDP